MLNPAPAGPSAALPVSTGLQSALGSSGSGLAALGTSRPESPQPTPATPPPAAAPTFLSSPLARTPVYPSGPGINATAFLSTPVQPAAPVLHISAAGRPSYLPPPTAAAAPLVLNPNAPSFTRFNPISARSSGVQAVA